MEYEGEVVHLISNGVDFLGKVSSRFDGDITLWWRILDPCFVVSVHDAKTGASQGVKISRIGSAYDHYEHYVDIYIPPQKTIQIRVLKKGSLLFDAYTKEINAPSMPKNIILPGMN